MGQAEYDVLCVQLIIPKEEGTFFLSSSYPTNTQRVEISTHNTGQYVVRRIMRGIGHVACGPAVQRLRAVGWSGFKRPPHALLKGRRREGRKGVGGKAGAKKKKNNEMNKHHHHHNFDIDLHRELDQALIKNSNPDSFFCRKEEKKKRISVKCQWGKER